MKTALIRCTAAILVSLAAVSAASAQSALTREQMQRRYQVRVMEGILVGAAQQGAQLLALRVQQIDPTIILLSGNAPRALGLVLEGHGIVFYVEVPSINPTVAWAMRNKVRDVAGETAIAKLRLYVQSVSDPQERADLEANLRRIEQRIVPPGSASQARQNGAMQVGGVPPLPNLAPVPTMDDPDAEYERLVTEQLVNAMLDYSHQLGLGADEWLTVAARGSQGPLETVFDASVTLTLRIKGSDLADFRAGRLTRDEARARVVIREF